MSKRIIIEVEHFTEKFSVALKLSDNEPFLTQEQSKRITKALSRVVDKINFIL